jgi:hypothetical protein
MSKTIRQKYLLQAQRPDCWKGNKVAGKYTVHDLQRDEDKIHYVWVWREPTKSERHSDWMTYHGESRSANHRTPGHYYRNKFESKLKTHNKHELVKWMKNHDYEPMCYERPSDCWWDWS